RYHTTSKGAQEAHEAIRPTYITTHEITGTAQEKKLYALIWKRTIASQMADAELERTTIDVMVNHVDECGTMAKTPDMLVATGEVIKFDGFLKVYMESTDDENAPGEDLTVLPKLIEGQRLQALEVVATQRFTQQPIRYTEASLVRRLEELGIGRPSTYAPTISTIQAREYVQKGEKKGEKREYEIITLKKGKITTRSKSEMVGAEKGKLIPTDIGMVVNDFLLKYFPSIMDYNFTARVENNFDEIAEGKERWNDEISRFYKDFHPNIEKVSTMRLEHKVGERVLGNDPKTGKPVSVKIGRYGPLVQLGSSDDEEKPRFASLLKNQSVSTLTLDEALRLFELPRVLDDYEGEPITVAVGRFGPYLKHGKTFVSIPKDIAPLEITQEQAVELIEAKRKADVQKVIKTFDEEPELQVLNGRFGPYINYKKQNYKIPRKTDPATLTLEDCRAIVEAGPAPKATRRRAARK
ncbi:MAG: DNA topoisomerase I, partial [Muribaculaceae bacterium]|nr:DNA topoisomerase I [Muribaculaceae bacterium]